MNQSGPGRMLSIFFLFAVMLTAVVFNAAKPRVMVLHSYHPDYPWTRDVNEGIERIARRWTDYSVTWHYMNTKRLSDKESLRYAGIVARRAIDQFDPMVLIAVDDLAQKLAARHYVDKPGMNIVFAGVNGSAKPYGYEGAENVTGIFERKPWQAVKEMVLTLEREQPQPKTRPRIHYLMDPSPSMQRDRAFIEAFDWSPLHLGGIFVADSYQRWKQQVHSLRGRNVDYLLVANYRKLPRSETDPGYPSPVEIMHWTEANSGIPVIGLNVFNVEDGAAIAVGASPFEQGEMAATMAEALLERGLKGSELAMVTNRQYVVAIHQDALRKRKLKLPQIYETFARTTATYIEGKQ